MTNNKGYTGITANQGFLNSVFEFFTPGKRGISNE